MRLPADWFSQTKHLSDPNIEIAALQKADLLKSAVKCGANRFLCIIIPPEMMKVGVVRPHQHPPSVFHSDKAQPCLVNSNCDLLLDVGCFLLDRTK